jgi:hypothetical protein
LTEQPLASISRIIQYPEYARARGRNGEFAPRSIEVEMTRHDDGTPLVRFSVYSRRHGEGPPIDVTVAVSEWRELSIDLAEQVARALEEGERLP